MALGVATSAFGNGGAPGTTPSAGGLHGIFATTILDQGPLFDGVWEITILPGPRIFDVSQGVFAGNFVVHHGTFNYRDVDGVRQLAIHYTGKGEIGACRQVGIYDASYTDGTLFLSVVSDPCAARVIELNDRPYDLVLPPEGV